MMTQQTILTITGSDGSGGSGLQADIRCISELGGTVTSAITSITVQNTLGIQSFYDLPASTVRTQIEAILNDLQPQVVKIGLLRRIDVVQVVAELMRKYHPKYIVYAPVLHSTRGDLLVEPQVYNAIQQLLIPLCTIVLEPSDLPTGKRQHGHANQLAAALAYYLSCGENVNEAMLHARTYVSLRPKGYTEENSRSGELYNLFLDAIDRFYHRYSDVAFYAEQLGVSARYLGQVTRSVAQRSPKSMIDERITEAISSQLTSTSKPLKEIALSFGFSSQAHLSRYYKKQSGRTPSDVRRIYQK
jgi:hydroxymethylpyrimidine/phosphomethylpyrimidine kinase